MITPDVREHEHAALDTHELEEQALDHEAHEEPEPQLDHEPEPELTRPAPQHGPVRVTWTRPAPFRPAGRPNTPGG